MGPRTGPARLVSRTVQLTNSFQRDPPAAAKWRWWPPSPRARRLFVICETQTVGTCRWAVDQAVGRAKQGRSTWPWSERWPVDASAAEKDRLRVCVCRPRAGQHRVPESRPKGGTALINMFKPALASLSLRRTALACTGPFKSGRSFPLCRQVGKGRDVPKNELLVL